MIVGTERGVNTEPSTVVRERSVMLDRRDRFRVSARSGWTRSGDDDPGDGNEHSSCDQSRAHTRSEDRDSPHQEELCDEWEPRYKGSESFCGEMEALGRLLEPRHVPVPAELPADFRI